MAISANELRIGNWVEKDGHYLKVDAIIDLPKKKEVSAKGKHLEGYFYFNDFNPIPLSPEILIALGFINVRDVHWCVPNSDPSKSFEVCLWSDHVSYTMSNHFHRELKYVHELQNLYFSLTQTELSYSPPQ